MYIYISGFQFRLNQLSFLLAFITFSTSIGPGGHCVVYVYSVYIAKYRREKRFLTLLYVQMNVCTA